MNYPRLRNYRELENEGRRRYGTLENSGFVYCVTCGEAIEPARIAEHRKDGHNVEVTGDVKGVSNADDTGDIEAWKFSKQKCKTCGHESGDHSSNGFCRPCGKICAERYNSTDPACALCLHLSTDHASPSAGSKCTVHGCECAGLEIRNTASTAKCSCGHQHIDHDKDGCNECACSNFEYKSE